MTNVGFSQAVQAGQTLYLSGCLGLDPKTGQFVGEGVKEQSRQVEQSFLTFSILFFRCSA